MLKHGGYCCGPTPYQFLHLGNYKTFYHAITHFNKEKRRASTKNLDRTRLLINITDIGDSIYGSAALKNCSNWTIVNHYTRIFIHTLKKLGLKPWAHSFIRASNEIKEMVKCINALLMDKKNYWDFNYSESEGLRAILNKDKKTEHFWTAKGSENDLGQEEKQFLQNKNFCIWRTSLKYPYYWYRPKAPLEILKKFKFPAFDFKNRTGLIGLPSWHLECAALVNKYLNQTFMHYGGTDLKCLHHYNQAAIFNTICLRDVKWAYVSPILIKLGEGSFDKISKSKGHTDYFIKYITDLQGSLLAKFYDKLSLSKVNRITLDEYHSQFKVTKILSYKKIKRKKLVFRLIKKRQKARVKMNFKLADFLRMRLMKENIHSKDQRKKSTYFQIIDKKIGN